MNVRFWNLNWYKLRNPVIRFQSLHWRTTNSYSTIRVILMNRRFFLSTTQNHAHWRTINLIKIHTRLHGPQIIPWPHEVNATAIKVPQIRTRLHDPRWWTKDHSSVWLDTKSTLDSYPTTRSIVFWSTRVSYQTTRSTLTHQGFFFFDYWIRAWLHRESILINQSCVRDSWHWWIRGSSWTKLSQYQRTRLYL